MRIAFFEARPTVVNNPTWKNTSLLKPRSIVANTVPMMPSGTTNMTATGIDQLSYSAARHRKTIVSEMAYNAPGLRARQTLLVGQSCPVIANPLWQLLDERLHRVQRIAATLAGRGRAQEFQRWRA